MAKSVTAVVDANEGKPAPAAKGHNLSPDEQQALLIHHFDKLRKQEAVAAEKKAEYDAEKSALTDLFRFAKADGFTRKELQALLDDSKALRRDLVAEEERRAKLRAWLGLPAGTQLDLFALPVEVQDEQHAEGQGYAVGLRGEECKTPDSMQPRHIPAFTRGWHAGQEKLAWGLAETGKIVDRRTDIAAQPVALEPEPEPDPLDPETIKKAARKVEASGFMERGDAGPSAMAPEAA